MATKSKPAPHREKISEDQLQGAIIEMAQYEGWSVFFIPNWLYALAVQSMSRRRRGDRQWSPPGFPDLVMVQGLKDTRTPVRLIFAELKSAKGVLRESQQRWLLSLSRVPGVEVYCWRPCCWQSGEVERIIRNGPNHDHACTEKEVVRARLQLGKVEQKQEEET